MPCSRHRSGTGVPASTWLNMDTILYIAANVGCAKAHQITYKLLRRRYNILAPHYFMVPVTNGVYGYTQFTCNALLAVTLFIHDLYHH